VDQLIPEIRLGDVSLAEIKTLEQIRAETRKPLIAALAFRDLQVNNDRATIINQAKTYINNHFSDSNLSLNEVAVQVNFSPNHFSAVFTNETGENFRDYLARARVEQAKKLLRSTSLKCAEVALRCGYNDPHYFSIIFRKSTGVPPQQFRILAKNRRQGGQDEY
jgi:two-component system response regulator YesN